MKRFSGIALSVAACSLASQAALAQTKLDTTKVQNLNEVVVKAVRASKDAPYAVANIKKAELQQFSRTGQELPFLLSRTPGILAWGENGLGTGTSYMRIRGAAGSRINVTLDGVALNSPEDQTVFWANMNSYAALLGSVQVQRGVVLLPMVMVPSVVASLWQQPPLPSSLPQNSPVHTVLTILIIQA